MLSNRASMRTDTAVRLRNLLDIPLLPLLCSLPNRANESRLMCCIGIEAASFPPMGIYELCFAPLDSRTIKVVGTISVRGGKSGCSMRSSNRVATLVPMS